MSEKILKKNILDKTTNFLKKNLKALIVLLALILTFLFAFMYYKNLKEKNNIYTAEMYSKAAILISREKISESKQILKEIIYKDHKLYSPLALYLIIDNNLESDNQKIINYFDRVLKNNLIKKENINLIKIKKSIYLIDLKKEELIIETLNPIINSDSIWRDMAINIISEYFLSTDQKIKSQEYIQLLNIKKNK
jgi:predicted negative regulator of RcsB-dependent stress response